MQQHSNRDQTGRFREGRAFGFSTMRTSAMRTLAMRISTVGLFEGARFQLVCLVFLLLLPGAGFGLTLSSVSTVGTCSSPGAVILTPQNPTATLSMVCQQITPPNPQYSLQQILSYTQLITPEPGWITFQNVTASPLIVGSFLGVSFAPGPLPDGSLIPSDPNLVSGLQFGPIRPFTLMPGEVYRQNIEANDRTYINAFGFTPTGTVADPTPFLGNGTFVIPLRFSLGSGIAFYSQGPNQFAQGQLRVLDYSIPLDVSAWPNSSQYLEYNFATPEPSAFVMTWFGMGALVLLHRVARHRGRGVVA